MTGTSNGNGVGVGTHGGGVLAAYGRIGWAQVAGIVGDAQCAWADYTGFHIGPLPAQAPPYTHLWAWTGSWLLRARVDGQEAIVGLLQPDADGPADTDGDAHPDAAPPVAGRHPARQPVRYVRYTAQTWPGAEKRVGPLHPDLTGRPVQLFQISGKRPVTFVRLAQRLAETRSIEGQIP